MTETLVLVKELQESVKKLGVDGTISVLKNARGGVVDAERKGVSDVLNMVTNHFGVSIESMIDEKTKSTKRKYALALSVFYLNTVFGYSLGSLSPVFKRSKSRLSRLAAIVAKCGNESFMQKAKKELDPKVKKINKNQ